MSGCLGVFGQEPLNVKFTVQIVEVDGQKHETDTKRLATVPAADLVVEVIWEGVPCFLATFPNVTKENS
jgi:hypothetical protein